MTSKSFFRNTLVISGALVAVIVAVNAWLDVYGLFRGVEGRRIRVYSNERTSKHLLSYRYVSSNFNGVLLGPSFSNNMDTGKLKRYSVYNASINGGNASEMKLLFDNFSRHGGIRFIIIGLHPYLTKDHGRKTASMSPTEYWGALGSPELARVYLYMLLNGTGRAKICCNEFGFNDDINVRTRAADSRVLIQKRAEGRGKVEIAIDEVSFSELGDVIARSRSAGIKVFAYYYPEPYEVFVAHEQSFRKYQERINLLFTEEDVLWDFNTEEYLDFRKGYGNYCDESHLSREGADYVLREIEKKLDGHS